MENYKEIAKEVRRTVLTMVHRGQTSHIGSNFSAVDLGVILYENLQEHDRVVWSKGWCAALIYTLLARKGVIPKEDLDKFPNPPYIGLAETSVKGVENCGGAMGHGLPVACGMALAKKRSGEPGRIFCIMSDGEMQEGTTWEAALFAAHHKLDNLTVIVDYNKWCAMGRTNEVLNLEPFGEKWKAFNWHTHRIDGHNYEEIEKAIWHACGDETCLTQPLAIICDTVKGKGVSFFEDSLLYHYKNVSDEEYKKAMRELDGLVFPSRKVGNRLIRCRR